jgi:dihydroorotase
VCSDHTPVDVDAKELPFSEAEPGTTGLELLLPLTLKWAAESGVALPTAVARITCDAARVLDIDAGHLQMGARADVCIFDPQRYWKVEPGVLKSQGKNTPYLGYELQGQVCFTVIEGQIAYEAVAETRKH